MADEIDAAASALNYGVQGIDFVRYGLILDRSTLCGSTISE
jgi:hypothetical protein